jgi:hypothetical protein
MEFFMTHLESSHEARPKTTHVIHLSCGAVRISAANEFPVAKREILGLFLDLALAQASHHLPLTLSSRWQNSLHFFRNAILSAASYQTTIAFTMNNGN